MVCGSDIENLRKTARENDAFLRFEDHFEEHDYDYTNEERIIPVKRDGSFLMFFLFQLLFSLVLLLLMFLWKYSMIPLGKEETELVNQIIDFIYQFHYT